MPGARARGRLRRDRGRRADARASFARAAPRSIRRRLDRVAARGEARRRRDRSSTRPAPPARRRAASSPTRTCSRPCAMYGERARARARAVLALPVPAAGARARARGAVRRARPRAARSPTGAATRSGCSTTSREARPTHFPSGPAHLREDPRPAPRARPRRAALRDAAVPLGARDRQRSARGRARRAAGRARSCGRATRSRTGSCCQRCAGCSAAGCGWR